MNVEIIASQTSDNYFYLIHSGPGSEGLLIDPVDAATAIDRARRMDVRVTKVVNTHWHPDHTRGNSEVLQATGAQLFVPTGERDLIEGEHRGLAGGDTLAVSGVQFKVFETPGHTVGHISLHTRGHLFCGDTIFVGGAGNCRFGGDARVLFETFTSVLTRFDDGTLIYPGHDYAVRNFEFCLDLEDANAAAATMLESAKQIKSEGGFIQSTLGQERSASPFMRCEDAELQATLASSYPDLWEKHRGCTSEAERAFVTVRELRNSW